MLAAKGTSMYRGEKRMKTYKQSYHCRAITNPNCTVHRKSIICFRTCLERPMPSGITCLVGLIFGKMSNTSVYMNLSPKTIIIEQPHFMSKGGGLLREVALYLYFNCYL